MAALTGVVTAYLPVQRWPRAGRLALHGGTGALTAGATAWFMTRLEKADDAGATPTPPPPPAFIAAVAALAGLTMTGVSRGGQAADTWTERQLTTRGVRRPRLWIGLGAAGVSLVSSAVDRLETPRERASAPEPPTA